MTLRFLRQVKEARGNNEARNAYTEELSAYERQAQEQGACTCWCFLRRRAALAPNISRRGSYFLSWAERHPRFKVLVPCVRSPPTVARSLSRLFPHHPGGNPGANLKSISHRCYLFEVAFA